MGGLASTEGGCDVADTGLSTTPMMFMVRPGAILRGVR